MTLRADQVIIVVLCATLVPWCRAQETGSRSPAQEQSPHPSQSKPQAPEKGQGQSPQQPQTSQSQTQSQETMSAPGMESNGARPGEHEKATAPPKPPVLRHTRRKRSAKRAPANDQSAANNPNSEPKKVVVRNGGESDDSVQLSPAINPEQARQQRTATTQLLAATTENLKRVAGRQLTPVEQGTLEQIHAYMRQAKAASSAGDTGRAQTLAYKARLLSNELLPK